MRKIVLLMGGPGSGKSTQAKKLCETKPNFIHVSTGDLIRAIIKDSSHPSSAEFQTYVQEGKLLSDEQVVSVLRPYLDTLAPHKTILLDGYPRTPEQAQSFQRNFGAPQAIVHLDVSADTLKTRALNRGEDREDDKEDIIQRRIQLFESETLPIILELKQTYPAITISTTADIDSTHQDLVAQLTPILERVEVLSVVSFVRQYLQTRSIYRISESVESTHRAANFSVRLSLFHTTYFLQSYEAVKQILTARTRLGTVYHQFSNAAGLQYDFVATDSGNGQPVHEDGRPNFWHLAHHGFKHAVAGDEKRIPTLIDKHFLSFLKSKRFVLDQAFETFFYSFWCDYLFGGAVDVNAYLQTREQIFKVMRFSFYENRFKSLDPYNFSSVFWSFFKRNDLRQAKTALKNFIRAAQDKDSWVSRFKAYLIDQNTTHSLGLPEELIEKIIEDNVFDLFFEPDFLEGVMYEGLVEVVNHQLDVADPTQQERAYRAGLDRAYLFPYRSRVLEEEVTLPDGTRIPRNSLVFINLKNSGLLHSAGLRACVGQNFSRIFREHFWQKLRDIRWTIESTSIPDERLALAGDDDVPVSPARFEVSWSFKRDSLQPKLPFHPYNGQRFYDVLAIYEDPEETALIVQQFFSKIHEMLTRDNLQATDVVVVGPEVRGLSIASVVAQAIGLRMVTIRKAGGYKMTEAEVYRETYDKGYQQTDTLELPKNKHSVLQGKHVVLIDDGIASGGSALACCRLVERLGGSVNLVLAMINHLYAEKTPALYTPGYQRSVETLFDFQNLPLPESNDAHQLPALRCTK